MKTRRIHIFLSLLIVCCLPTESLRIEPRAVGAQTMPSLAEERTPDSETDTQLRINKTTLLEGKSDKNRIDAATLLLFSESPAARGIVLDVLRRTDNPRARAAVCEALNPMRLWGKSLKNKDDFIKPLIGVLTSEEDVVIAHAAARATLLFAYSQVQEDVEKVVMDQSLPVNIRMNMIYVLRRHPDKQAVTKLINLLDGSDPQMAEAAKTALIYDGVSVSGDGAARRQMIARLQAQTVEAFLRERLIQQETRVWELEADRDSWQKQYLTALNSLYDSLTDQAAKNRLMMQQLTAAEIPVRAWAVDKLGELRNANAQMKLSDYEPIFLSLIVDPSRQVRLKTARLLARIGELNVAKPLLEQLNVETDDQVRREILVALREACYVGSLGTTGHKVPDDVRRQTLEWAVRFLGEADGEKVRNGAEVIGKLLEQDGLKPDEVEHYLKTLLDRYSQAGVAADPGMRGCLLGAMAGLCATRSTCREQAVKLYGGLFEQALADKEGVVRQNAVDGLVNIDKLSALRKLRETMANDSNVAIRQKLVDLAGEIGGPQDLEWLAEKVGAAGEGESVWHAMLKIFRSDRSDLTVLANWAVKIEVLAKAGKVTVEQGITFFTLVEQKAKSENKADLLKDVRARLARLYVANNNFKQASECLRGLLDVAVTEEEKERVQAQLLPVYLGLSSMDQTSELVSKCLSAKNLDLTPNGFVVKSIEEYLNSPTTTDPGILLTVLKGIKVKDPGTMQTWGELLSQWSERFAKAKKTEDGGRTNN